MHASNRRSAHNTTGSGETGPAGRRCLPARRSVALIVVLGMGLLAACSPDALQDEEEADSVADEASELPGEESTETTAGLAPAGTSEVSIKLRSDWDSFDPPILRTAGGYQLAMYLYDRMVMYRSGEIVPWLAESWDVDDTTALFTIKEGVTCADGSPLTASVVAGSLERITEMDPAQSRGIFGEAGLENIEADDDTREIRIELGAAHSDLLVGLSRPQAGIVCEAGQSDPDSLVTAPSGSGPFVLEDATRGDRAVLAAREGYDWGPDDASTDIEGFPGTLIARVVEEETTASNMLLAGDLQAAIVDGPDRERLSAREDLQHMVEATWGTWVVLFNHSEDRPTSSRAVRLALSHALDRDALNSPLTGGAGDLARSMIPPDADCAADLAHLIPDHDDATARSILEEEGFTFEDDVVASDGEQVELLLAGSITHSGAGELIVEQLTGFGFDVNARITARSTFIGNLLDGNFDVAIYNYQPPTPTPSDFLTIAAGPTPADGGFNFLRAANAEGEEAVGRAMSTDDLSQRCSEFEAMQEAYLTEMNTLPIAVATANWFTHGLTFETIGGVLVDPFTLRVSNN